MRGDETVGEFYSIAISNNLQQIDSGANAAFGAQHIQQDYFQGHFGGALVQRLSRVSVHPKAANARNFTQCDSLLIGNKCAAHTVPYIEAKNISAVLEHEATTSKISDDQMFYYASAWPSEEAVALMVNGFCRDVLQNLPMEFAVEAQKLVGISLEVSDNGRWKLKICTPVLMKRPF